MTEWQRPNEVTAGGEGERRARACVLVPAIASAYGACGAARWSNLRREHPTLFIAPRFGVVLVAQRQKRQREDACSSKTRTHRAMSVATPPRRLTSTTCSSSSAPAPRSRSKVETKNVLFCVVLLRIRISLDPIHTKERVAASCLPIHTYILMHSTTLSLSLSLHTFHRLPPLLASGRTCVTMPRPLTHAHARPHARPHRRHGRLPGNCREERSTPHAPSPAQMF
jgi:hypothetical protein